MTGYLSKAPTLIVIGVTGFVSYTVLCAEGETGPPKAERKPPSVEKNDPSVASNSLRNPFLMVKPAEVAAVATVASTTEGPRRDGPAAKENPAEPPPEPEDEILETMRLIGTFVDSREQLAVINNKVYARGDQLRGVDGSMLPYIITEVRKDRALVRRGRRDFEIAFSDAPATAAARVPTPPRPGEDKAMAKTETGAKFTPIARRGRGPTKGDNGGLPGMDNDTDSQRNLLMQLLSSLGGSQGGGGGNLPGGLGALTGSNSSALNSLLNPGSIGAGLDALSGKLDNIGQAGGNGP